MGVYTPNLNLYKPDVKENGWADKMNATLDLLDKMLAWNIHTITDDDTILSTDGVVCFDRTAGSIAAVLPPQVDCVPRKPIFIKIKKDGQGDDGSKIVTLTAEDGALINGGASIDLTMENESKILVPTGDGWDIY